MINNDLIICQDLLYYCNPYTYNYNNKKYYCDVKKYFKDKLLSKPTHSIYLPFYIYRFINKKFRLYIC